jgi:hypothetical protein
VVRLPYATPEDMHTVASMLGEPDTEQTPRVVPPQDSPTLTPEFLKQQRQRLGLSLQDVVDRTGVKNKMQLSRFEHGQATLTETEQADVFRVLQPGNGTGRRL